MECPFKPGDEVMPLTYEECAALLVYLGYAFSPDMKPRIPLDQIYTVTSVFLSDNRFLITLKDVDTGTIPGMEGDNLWDARFFRKVQRPKQEMSVERFSDIPQGGEQWDNRVRERELIDA